MGNLEPVPPPLNTILKYVNTATTNNIQNQLKIVFYAYETGKTRGVAESYFLVLLYQR